LDGALDVAGSSIWMAYNNIPPNQSNRWSDAQITWNDTFLPAISDLWDEDSPLFGLTSEERVGGDPVNKPITEKTLLMTVGYWYFPGAEGDSGSTFYTIGADALDTVFGDELAKQIPDLNIVTGSVTIGEGVVPEPCTLAVLGIGIAGLAGFGRKRTRKNSA